MLAKLSKSLLHRLPAYPYTQHTAGVVGGPVGCPAAAGGSCGGLKIRKSPPPKTPKICRDQPQRLAQWLCVSGTRGSSGTQGTDRLPDHPKVYLLYCWGPEGPQSQGRVSHLREASNRLHGISVRRAAPDVLSVGLPDSSAGGRKPPQAVVHLERRLQSRRAQVRKGAAAHQC